MGSLCARLKNRLGGSNAPRYNPLRTEASSSGSSSGEYGHDPSSLWREAGDRSHGGDSPAQIRLDSMQEDDETVAEVQFDKMSAQIKHLYQPIDFLRNAVLNSLLLFKVSLGLSRTSTMEECFQELKEASNGLPGIELIKTSDGPRKLSVTPELRKILSDDVQASVKHFNSMLSSSHKYLGNKELKLVDIQLKLEDMKLLPKKNARASKYKELKEITEAINNFTNEITSLFDEITSASQLFEHQVLVTTINGITE